MKRIIAALIIGMAVQASAVDITRLELIANGKTADYLAGKLGKIYGKEFKASSGNGKTGIAVGTPADFPELNLTLEHPQEFLVRTHADGIHVIGATPQAVGYAAAELLYQTGYRYFFPVEKWEIYPAEPRAELSLDVHEKPDYLTRSIWPGWGLWPDYRKAAGEAEWKSFNRLGGVDLKTSHMYDSFIGHNRKVFDEHPEYYALYQGERKSTKLCISNPELRRLFCDYVLSAFRRNPALESHSADPSDGGGWCECEPCVKLGTPSDRAVMLANAAAEAVNAEFPGKVIGMYAYNMHSPPPAIKVHPQVVICVATGFIKDGWTVEKLIEGWHKQGATIGIREYYYAGPQPGTGRGADLEYLRRTISAFHKTGVRYMIAESSDAWGPGGLGYYIAARMLWNAGVDSAALEDDFYRRAFPGAQAEMRGFYQLLNGSKPRPLNADLLGRMYRALDKARQQAASPAELSRIDAMVCYARSCELLFTLENEQSMAGYVNLLKFAAATRGERLLHSYAMHRDDRQLLPGKIRGQKIPEIDWQNTPPPSQEELAAFIKDGIANYQLLDFEPVEFSRELRRISFDAKPGAIDFGTIRGPRSFYVWCDGKPFTLGITGGLIKHYRDRGNVEVQLIQIGGQSDTGELETLIQEDKSVPPDGELREVVLTPKYAGLHRITINDNHDMTSIKWPDGLTVSMPVDRESAPAFSGTYYFYVPKGTKTLGYYAKMSRGRIIGPDGKMQQELQKTNGFYSLPVPAGMDGKVWTLRGVNGVIRLLTVPSNLSLNAGHMLLPEDIAKDLK